MTPIGMAIGLGVRETYDPDSATALIVQGCLDSFSAGILLYTGLVELLAHEFIFSSQFKNAPMSKVCYAFFCLILGAGIMVRPRFSCALLTRAGSSRSRASSPRCFRTDAAQWA